MIHLDSFHDAHLTGPEAAALFARRFGEGADGKARLAVDLAGTWGTQGYAGTFRLDGGTCTYRITGDHAGTWNVYLDEPTS